MPGYKKGEAVVVTGAAQGIGRAIAVELAKRGLLLALWDISDEGLAETARLCAAHGPAPLVQKVDVGASESIGAAAAVAIERTRRSSAS